MLQHKFDETPTSTPAVQDEIFNPLQYREPEEVANDNEPEEAYSQRDFTLMTRGVHYGTGAEEEECWPTEEEGRQELDFTESRRSRRGFLDDVMGWE